MEIKVRAVDSNGEKSVQEVENELLEKHEQETQANEESTEVASTGETEVESSTESAATEEVQEDVQQETETQTQSSELNEEDVLSFIKNRYNREINSIDDLVVEQEQTEELPEDVSAFLKFKKDTGRGLDDFIKINTDYSKADPEKLLFDYYKEMEPDLEDDDISFILEDKFSFDEDLDETSDIKSKKLSKKRELARARNYFNDLKETYLKPLESRVSDGVDNKSAKNSNANKDIDAAQELNRKKNEYYAEKTNELFNDSFKGFEFKVNDNKSVVYSPGSVDQLRKNDINSFISKHLNDEGFLKDASQYHRALSIASNPEKFAKFFYELGASEAVEDVSRKSKNINMDIRQSPQSTPKPGMKIRAISQDSGRGLKIRSIKKKN